MSNNRIGMCEEVKIVKRIILHVLAMSTYSGAENVVCQIINMYKNDSNTEMIYCSPEGAIREVLNRHGISFEPMNKLSYSEIKRVIRKVQPTYIHAHDVRASLLVAFACGRIPFISHMHNNWENLRNLSIKSLLYLIPASKAKNIIWVSQSAYDEYFFKNKFQAKSVVLKNIIDVIDIRKRVTKVNNNYDIVYVGRLTYQKNPERLITVIEKIAQSNNHIKAAIIGDGDLREQLAIMIKEKDLSETISLLGYINNPLEIVKGAKVMLMTSRWEGTPMCVLEALALGVPVVGTPTDGILDLIETNRNGYLSDDDNELATQALKIIEDEELRRKMSQLAMRESEKYNSVDRYKKILDEVYTGQ